MYKTRLDIKKTKKTKAIEDYPCQDYEVPEMVRQNNKNQL
jgi:hypothetical protein